MRAVAPLYILSLVMSEHVASGGSRARRLPPDAPSLRYTFPAADFVGRDPAIRQ